MHKPRETRDIYLESLAVNSSTLEKQLADKGVPHQEISDILAIINERYGNRVEKIVFECKQDMMALERVPSPLRLFIECLAESASSVNLSPPSRQLIELYRSSWEDWM